MFLRGIYTRRRVSTETEQSSSRTERRSSKQSAESRNSNQSTSSTFRISIPPNVKCGDEFRVYAGGRVCCVRCPPDAKPGASLQITVPLSEDTQNMSPELIPRTRTTSFESATSTLTTSNRSLMDARTDDTQMFEVTVPRGATPGQPFSLLAGGTRVLVTCPLNGTTGQKIRFNLPIKMLNQSDNSPKSMLAKIKMSYSNKDGWARTLRAEDMKFVWTRFDEQGNVDGLTRFNTDRSAYVLKLHYLDGEHSHLRQGEISLVTPDEVYMDSFIKNADGSELLCYPDIVSAQNKSYSDKVQFFRDVCGQLRSNEGHIKINVRRDELLLDSIDAIMRLSREDLRKCWRFEFIGEAGLDAGGLKTEWFDLVTKAVFDPSLGLWQTSLTNQLCVQINPSSGICCPEDHLIFFRFIGRVMGKALFDAELVNGHMCSYMYKHMLGWPVMFNDLKDVDEEYYSSLKGLKKYGQDIEHFCVNFTVVEEVFGMKKTVDLVSGGTDINLTQDNLPEYIEACLMYRLLGRYDAQLNELLLAFFDVIPDSLLVIFDFQEIELLMCGLPKIDVSDWKEHTEYTGEYDREGSNHQVCKWFWEVVSEYDQEMKARLLQFVTGTSGVPSNGFEFLQGSEGVRQFTIQGVELETCLYPRAHTCFNRIDLPRYEEREELAEKLKISITMSATGFDLE